MSRGQAAGTGQQPDLPPGETAASTAAQATAAAPGSAPSGSPAAAGQLNAATLLAVESKVRAARDELELQHLIANELRKLVAGRQAMVLRASAPDVFRITTVSSLVLTDKETPFVRWIEDMVATLVAERGAGEAVDFELPAYVDPAAPETRNYPFVYFSWAPMRLPTGETFAGVLIARERPWSDQDLRVIARETEVFGGAWQALHGARALQPRRMFSRRTKFVAAAAIVALTLLPVPMTTLAPVEIVARAPQRVTAPLDGVIKDILIEPNRPVRTGEAILRFDETTLRNRLQVAEQEMRLAQSRFERATQAAFADDKARHELAQARAELSIKRAERDYASDLLTRTVITAERDGILLYSDKDRWIGRPVKTGERIMQIVGPDEIAARIEVPVADAIQLEQGARVRMFLDSNPLSAIPARIVSEGYQPEPNSTQQLVYRLQADIGDKRDGLRIGSRGTAQLYGRLVPLAFYLLRRPITAARQHIGL